VSLSQLEAVAAGAMEEEEAAGPIMEPGVWHELIGNDIEIKVGTKHTGVWWMCYMMWDSALIKGIVMY